MTALDKAKEFMMMGGAFVQFLHLVSSIVYFSLDLVSAEVKDKDGLTEMTRRRYLSSGIPSVRFIVDWNMAGPIVRQKAQALIADRERDYMDASYEAKDQPVIFYDSNGSDRA